MHVSKFRIMVVRGDFLPTVWLLAMGLTSMLLHSPLWAVPQAADCQAGLEPSADRVFGTGHLRGSMACTTFSPDGKFAVTVGDKKAIQFWDVATGELHHEWPSQFGGGTAISYSPDGSRLAVAGRLDTLEIWDANSGDKILTHSRDEGRGNDITSLAFSPDGMRLLCGTRGARAYVRDAETGALLAELVQGQVGIEADVAWSPDGKSCLVTMRSGLVFIYDGETYAELRQFKPHEAHEVTGLEFLSATEFLTAATATIRREPERAYRAEIKLWEIRSGDLIRTVYAGPEGTAIRGACLTPDKKQLVLARPRDVAVLSLASGEIVNRFGQLPNRAPYPHGLAVSHDGTLIGLTIGNAEVLRLFETATGSRILPPDAGHDDQVLGLAVSPDGSQLATFGHDSNVHIWDTATGETRHSFACGVGWYPRAGVWSPDGRYVYFAGQRLTSRHNDGYAAALDVAANSVLFERNLPVLAFACAISQDGKHVAFAGGNDRSVGGNADGVSYVEVVNATTGRASVPIRGSGTYGSMRFNNGTTISAATFYAGRTIDTWDLRSKTLIQELPFVTVRNGNFAQAAARFTAIMPDQTVQVVDSETITQVCVLREPDRWYSHAILSPDGKWLATTSRPTETVDGRLRPASFSKDQLSVWSIETRELVYRVELELTFWEFCFSADNSWLYGGSPSGIAAGWNLTEATQRPSNSQCQSLPASKPALWYCPWSRRATCRRGRT